MKKITLIGIGTGAETLTKAAEKAIEAADVLIGAKRLIGFFDKPSFAEYRPNEIRQYIENSDKSRFCVLLSGDTGFYSGAKGILAALDGMDVEVMAGISSFAYFFAKLKKDYSDVKFASLHGRNCNFITYIKRYNKVFFLLEKDGVKKICDGLCKYGMNNIRLFVGENLSAESERITTGTAEELKGRDFDALSVLLAENDAVQAKFGSIADEDFIRGKVPMTKSEIRSLSLAKLNLDENSVLYDIGAGTGSVSIEAAQYLLNGAVYAFEKNPEALGLLEKNKMRFACDNVHIIEGEAPKSFDFDKLPVPTHAFVGGSGGELKEIIGTLFVVNKNIRIAVNAVSLNTVSEIFELADKYEAEICCINTSRAEKAGTHLLMKAQNPVYIALFTEKKQ